MILQIDDRYWEKGLHNFEENLSQPRHRWYPFKEGFSNQLVRAAIESNQTNSKRLRVIDPFGGSGTTAVTASLLGHGATTVEVNPFCAFASRVKCLPGRWNEKLYRRNLDRVMFTAGRDMQASPLEGFSTFTKRGKMDKWLFNLPVIRAYSSLLRAVNGEATQYDGPLKLAAIKAAMSLCNALKDGKALRYKSDWQDQSYTRQDLFLEFRRNALAFRNDTVLAPIRAVDGSKVIRADSRQALTSIRANSYDLMITSPPYLNSFDYSDVYRPELFLGGYIATNEELSKIRHKTIRSHVQVAWKGETCVESHLLSPIIKMLREAKNLWNRRIPEMVEAYFHDLEKVLIQSRRILCKNAEMWIVVSTSSYGGVLIPVDLIIADIACRNGFKLDRICVMRNLRSAGQQKRAYVQGLPLRESLIVLKNS